MGTPADQSKEYLQELRVREIFETYSSTRVFEYMYMYRYRFI